MRSLTIFVWARLKLHTTASRFFSIVFCIGCCMSSFGQTMMLRTDSQRDPSVAVRSFLRAIPAQAPDSGRVASRVVKGSMPKPVESGAAQRTSRLDHRTAIQVTIVLQPPNAERLSGLLNEILNPKSVRFHQFLTFEQWKSSYAPTDQDIQAVSDWAAAAGLKEVRRYGSNLALVTQGTVSAAEKTFKVNLNGYRLDSRYFYGNDRRPTVPSEMAGRIKDILGLSSYEHVRGGAFKAPLFDEAKPRVFSGPFEVKSEMHADGAANTKQGQMRPRLPDSIRANITGPLGTALIEPPDLWSSQAYDYDALARLSHCCNPTNAPGGAPQQTSIAIIGTNKPSDNDIKQFAQTYGLAFNITEHMISGPSCCDDEMTTDIEWAGATSNSFGSYLQTAHIHVYEGGGTKISDLLDAWQSAFSDNQARIASSSFGSAESAYGSFLDLGTPGISDFTDITSGMAATGWTIVIADGDQGAYADCSSLSVQYPASDWNVIAVGGTRLNLTNGTAGLGFGYERAWTGNGCQGPQGNGGGGGGGCSGTFFAPSWNSVGACGDNRRSIPDLSLNAGSPQAVYYGGAWSGFFGTSIAAPEIAGFFAQANSYLAFIGLSGQICGPIHNLPCGTVGPAGAALYAAVGAPHNPFYDVKDGSCNGGGPGVGYCATPGYDKATGWGSANMLQLAWAINWFYNSQRSTPPVITFSGPSTGAWYAADETISFTIGQASMGIAGFTARWDNDPGDPMSHATPGSGDPFWDGPGVPFGNSGSLDLASAGRGCHMAYVRAWDNDGVSSLGTYGPVCFGDPPNCWITFSCPFRGYFPPNYTIQCNATVNFSEDFIVGPSTYLLAGTQYSGSATSVFGGASIGACFPNTNNCTSFDIYKGPSEWCGPPPPPPPPNFCQNCTKRGGFCSTVDGKKTCVSQ
jgi:hypothetical protein